MKFLLLVVLDSGFEFEDEDEQWDEEDSGSRNEKSNSTQWKRRLI